jgi:ribonuclease P protein component
MLPKIKRLDKASFSRVFSAGKVYNMALFSAKIAPSSKDQFSAVVGKKVELRAAKRNYLRRKIYRAIREILQQEHVKGLSVIFIAKKAIISASYEDIKAEVTRLLNRS